MNPEPQTIPVAEPQIFKPTGRKPKGKIAELPRAQRDIVNKMLDDGATYAVVESEMAKHGVSLNGENISNWFQSGFQQYLQHQSHLAEMRLLRENASDLVHDYNVVQFHQAANQVAVGRIFKALNQQELTDDPPNYIRTLNALARLSRAALVLKQYEDDNIKPVAQITPSASIQDPETQRKLMLAAFEGATGVKAAPGPIGPDLNQSLGRSCGHHDPNSIPALSKAPNLPSERASVASSSSPSGPSNPSFRESIENPEPCPQCFAPLPPLLASGERLYSHCQKCGAPLRPPGALVEYCPHCRTLLPELNSAGHRPTPDCPHCNQSLPPPPLNLNAAPNRNPQLPHAA